MTTDTSLHPLDQAIALTTAAPGHYRGHLPPTYANMVGPFGGVIAAAMLNGILVHPEKQGDPVTVTINFAGPIADAPFELFTRIVRTNRSNQHWYAEITQGGQIAATATAILASRQNSWSDNELPFPDVPPAGTVKPWLIAAGPVWVKRYEFRMLEGILPLSGIPQPDSRSVLWVRDEPPRPLDFCALLALSDVFFPRIFMRQQKLGPAGTVSMTTHFHADAAALAHQGNRPLLACARAQRFYNNYFDQVAELWSDDGNLLASSSQSVYFKD